MAPPCCTWISCESDALLRLGRFDDAADVALPGFQAARQAGLHDWVRARVLAANASEALLACGRTAEAAELIDPLITGPPDRDDWSIHECRSEIDLLERRHRGGHPAAAAIQNLGQTVPGPSNGRVKPGSGPRI